MKSSNVHEKQVDIQKLEHAINTILSILNVEIK